MIVAFSPEQAQTEIEQLADLLMDAVDSGASIGFMPPLARGGRVLLAAMDGSIVQGSVQLDLELRANGNHRAEVMKLLVHRAARRRGLARALMAEVKATARCFGRTLLLMDTRKGGEAEKLCEALGYTEYGEVPEYARSGIGELHSTVFFYCQLD